MPHGYCYLWDPWILWLHVISDSLITLAYFCIPVALVYFARKRRDLPFNWIFSMFGLFIVGCGTTHLMEVWTVWHASYLLAGLIKAFTAAVSVITAVLLIPLIPKVIALPSLNRLEVLNHELEMQVAEREQAQGALKESLAASEQAFKELAEQKSTLTEVKRAEGELRESQEQLKTIIQTAMDAIITLDSQQRVVLFNAAAERMFGCSLAQVAGRSIDRFIPQRFRSSHSTHIRRFGETGVTSRRTGTLGMLWALRSDGAEFPIEASISQTAVSGRKLFTVILRDLSGRKVTEERILRLASIVESSEDAIFSIDLTGMVTSWNRGAERLYGYPETEILGRNMNLLVLQERRGEVLHFLTEVEQGRGVTGHETVHRCHGGRRAHLSLVVSPLRDFDGRISVLLSSCRKHTRPRLPRKPILRSRVERRRTDRQQTGSTWTKGQAERTIFPGFVQPDGFFCTVSGVKGGASLPIS